VNSKAAIFKTAIRLFAAQGFEATTTLQIARETGITEPAVFYHFKNKNTLFSAIVEVGTDFYVKQLDRLAHSGLESFEAIEALIRMHFWVVRQEPEIIRILLRNCPARLADLDSACRECGQLIRSKLKRTVVGIIEKGVAREAFRPVNVDTTANLMIALLNGLVRQQIAAFDRLDGVEEAAIEFCQTGLAKSPGSEGRSQKAPMIFTLSDNVWC
jgi:AcrR family transcriptional regulator